MRLWIDLANSPHVPFFKALAARFVERGHEIEITARDFAETVPLAKAAGFAPQIVGAHGGRQVSAKAGNLMSRAWSLATWARKRQFDLAISHNSYSQILAARGLRIRRITLMDYEYQPANHLAFRLTSRIIVPASFPAKRLRRYGASVGKVRRYHGTKEDVYLADFQPDPSFATQLCELGVRPDNVLVLMRPPAHDALYHRFENKLFDDALALLLSRENVQVVLLPRNETQRAKYFAKTSDRLIVPAKPVDGANLIAASDLVISAGGTINREAAALGVPVASVYAGSWAAVDEELVGEGRLNRISNTADLSELRVEKKGHSIPRRASAVIDEIVNLIFSEAKLIRAERKREQLTDASAVRVPGRAPKWIIPTVKVLLVITDLLVAAGSFIFAFSLREGVSAFASEGGVVWSDRFAPYAALLLFITGIRLLCFRYYDLYRLRGEFSFVDDGIRIFKATAVGSLLIVAAAFLYRGGFEFRAFSYARGVFVVDFFVVLIAIGVTRLVMRSVQTFVRERQINLIPTLIVGRGPEAALFIREMRERPALGYRVIGVVETQVPDLVHAGNYEGVPVIATLEALPEAIRDSGANEVIIADPQVSGDALFEVMIRCGRRRGVEFRIAPSLFNCLPRKTEIDQIGVLPMIRLFREPLSSGARILKRTFDIVMSTLAVVLLSPLWLLLSLLIKLDSKGPVFYTQERVGMDGRLFLLYKFRTMVADADPELHREYQRAFIAGRAEANLGNAQKPTYKLFADPRITRVGKFLRRTSLDEVPQLFNVLMGDMSVVGPRPPIPYEVEAYELWHRKRLDMKPGLTGLWQVSGRNRLPFEEMVRLDLFYIENWSLLLDLKIILRTGFVMIGREGY